MFRRILVLLWVLALFGAQVGCGGEGDEPEDMSMEADALAARLSVMSLMLVSLAPQGGGPLDNALPCTRRGVVNYMDTSTGRVVRLSGCDLGDGVVIDGAGELVWEGPPQAITRMEFSGELHPWLHGEPQEPITSFALSALEYTVVDAVSLPIDQQIQLGALTVTLHGNTGTVTETTLPAQIFATEGLDVGSLPNPSGALATLTEADQKRLALHGFMFLARMLVDETLENRGEHTHENACGTVHVTYDAQSLPRVVARWNECQDMGLVFTGEFALEWAAPPGDEELGMIMPTGELTMGGGIPEITLQGFSWSMTAPTELPGEGAVDVELTRIDESLAFSHPVLLDD